MNPEPQGLYTWQKKRLPGRRKAVTIAIGVVGTDGVVIAADTQETIGATKTDESKMLIANRGIKMAKHGALAISGAGDGSYLDTLNQELCSSFMSRNWDMPSFASRAKKIVRSFHLDHVVPFGKFRDCPEIYVVAGAQLGDDICLWESDKSTFRPCRKYSAVGIGHAYARVMLRRYWTEMDVIKAASLAAFVIFKVKESVEACGNHTQIAIIKNGYAEYLSQPKIDMLEYAFDEYGAFETLAFQFILGLDLTEANIENELAKFSAKLRSIRTDIETTHRFDMARRRAGVRPTDEPEIRRPLRRPD
jgi:20S proteasome alpha/beta subunit